MAALAERPGVRGAPAGVEVARQAFLYGNGDGVPVVSVARLAELANVHPATINRWIPGWIKERENLLLSAGNSGFTLSLSPGVLEFHRANTAFLEEQTAKTRREIHAAEDLEKILKRAVSECAVYDPQSALDVLNTVQAFCNLVSGKKALQALFLNYQRAWKENAGIDSLQDVATAREKALATGRARLDLKRESDGAGPVPTGGREVPDTDPVFDVGTAEMPADDVEDYG